MVMELIGDVAVIEFSGGLDTVRGVQLYAELMNVPAAARKVVLIINSEGGWSEYADELCEMLDALRQRATLYTFAEFVAISAGLQLLMTGDTVGAHPRARLGSIGVVLRDQAERATAWTPGKLARPSPPPTTSDRLILDQTLDGFVEFIAQRRGLPRAEVRRLADGRRFTGSDAQRLGLVDRVCSRRQFLQPILPAEVGMGGAVFVG
jgi:protease-4